jgi:hypothetical protein
VPRCPGRWRGGGLGGRALPTPQHGRWRRVCTSDGGGGSRARVARLAVVRWSWTRRGGTWPWTRRGGTAAAGSTRTVCIRSAPASPQRRRLAPPAWLALASAPVYLARSLGLCSLLLQRHRSCAVLLAAARVPGRTAAFSSPLRVLSSRHPPCLRLDHVHALVRLYRSTRSRSSTRLGCTSRPAHFKSKARPFAPSSSNT